MCLEIGYKGNQIRLNKCTVKTINDVTEEAPSPRKVAPPIKCVYYFSNKKLNPFSLKNLFLDFVPPPRIIDLLLMQ